MDIVGENIRKIRRAKGLLQKELAGLAKMDASNLSKLERGEYTWTRENLERVAKALGVGVGDFFTADPKVPLLGYVKAGFGNEIAPSETWRAFQAIDAKLDQILVALESA